MRGQVRPGDRGTSCPGHPTTVFTLHAPRSTLHTPRGVRSGRRARRCRPARPRLRVVPGRRGRPDRQSHLRRTTPCVDVHPPALQRLAFRSPARSRTRLGRAARAGGPRGRGRLRRSHADRLSSIGAGRDPGPAVVEVELKRMRSGPQCCKRAAGAGPPTSPVRRRSNHPRLDQGGKPGFIAETGVNPELQVQPLELLISGDIAPAPAIASRSAR